ncbi:MAG: WYL domain-containing protein [Longimicrobiales bacterium]|nr:WYL domain-containing protein [Longimicrobiales bacterium]
MVDGTHADERLERLLYVLPAASRKEGASLAELAAALGTSAERISQDLEELTARAYYHPGGWPDDVSIMLTGDRVWVHHAAGFERPMRLSPRETLCLALALRGTAAASHLCDIERRRDLMERAEKHLGAGMWSKEDDTPIQDQDHVPDPTGIRETLLVAARDRRPCAIVYAKSGADDMDARVIHPYALVHAGGEWYTVGWCAVKEGMRVFRLDRILEAAEADGTFQAPEGFDPREYVTATRVYLAADDVEVRVRYSPKIARWVRERAAAGMVGWEEEPDGSLIIRHRVADPHWVVSHALTYGPEAEILGPEEVRALVQEVVRGMLG